MSKEAIINKIISDAEIRAKAVLNEANDKADEILATAAEECKQYLAKSKYETDIAVQDIAKRGETVAELDARKLVLGAKSQVLNGTYALVLDKLKALDLKQYKALIFGMLDKAEDGDMVIISAREKDIITKDVVSKIAKQKGITLSLCDKMGDFDGGIILSNNGIDKNFTFDVELSLLREDTEAKIAKEIIG